jgi:signal transduction histidine kinase
MQKARILVVEDDLNLLEGVRSVLEIDGHTVYTAENGHQALELLHETTRRGSHHMPEIVVSDIMMPHMDGIELLQKMRLHDEWVNIPFIFLTARGDKSDIQRGKQMGVDDYLVKPFDPQDLLVAVEGRLKRMRGIERARASDMTDVKKRILAILNHEFRTPLTFVVAYADMLSEHQSQQLSEADMATFLQGVSTGAVRLRRLVENFITLVEFETGEATRNYELRRSLIGDVHRMFVTARSNVLSPSDSNPVTITVQPDLPRFYGDATYIQIAINQLLANAVKFSPEGSPVAMTAEYLPESDEVLLCVSDQGRGIPEAEITRIYETFYQIDRVVYEDQGSGSGLAIVRHVVQLHGARISCESTVGHGTSFCLYFRAASGG